MCLRLGLIASAVLVASMGAGRPAPAGANHKATARTEDRPAFWRSIKVLAFEVPAVRDARGDEREYTIALRRLIDGDPAAAGALRSLIQADDPHVRRKAQRLYVGLLAADSRWAEIELPSCEAEPGLPAEMIAELAKLPPESLTFPDEPVTLPARRARFIGTPIIPVSVNGHTRWFWLDTGAGLTVLASDTAEAAGVDPLGVATTRIGTATTRTVEARPAAIDDLALGEVHFHNHPVMILREQDMQAKLFGLFTLLKIDGILGWNALSRLDLEIDLSALSVILRRPAHETPATRNLFWLGEPLVRGQGPDGADLLLSLDTGVRRSFGMPGLLQKTRLQVTGERTQRVGGAGGSAPMSVRTIVPVEATVSECSVPLAEVRDEWRPERAVFLDGFLGIDLSQGGWMRIDATNGRFECRRDTPWPRGFERASARLASDGPPAPDCDPHLGAPFARGWEGQTETPCTHTRAEAPRESRVIESLPPPNANGTSATSGESGDASVTAEGARGNAKATVTRGCGMIPPQ